MLRIDDVFVGLDSRFDGDAMKPCAEEKGWEGKTQTAKGICSNFKCSLEHTTS